MKKMKTVAIFLLLAFIHLYTSAKLPSTFKKCERTQTDFNQCLIKAIEDASRNLKEPIKEYGLPSLHPLKIPSLRVGAGAGPVAFEQIYKDMKLSGFESVTCLEANMDFEKGSLSIHCLFPEFRMDFIYYMNGKIFMLPFKGNGPGHFYFKNLDYKLSFDLEEYTRKNVKYYKVIKTKLSMKPEDLSFKLENLFDGNKALAESMDGMLNENWREIYADVKASYEDAFGQISGSIFNQLLSKVPVFEIFGEV